MRKEKGRRKERKAHTVGQTEKRNRRENATKENMGEYENAPH